MEAFLLPDSFRVVGGNQRRLVRCLALALVRR